jgi:hypothetical protein
MGREEPLSASIRHKYDHRHDGGKASGPSPGESLKTKRFREPARVPIFPDTSLFFRTPLHLAGLSLVLDGLQICCQCMAASTPENRRYSDPETDEDWVCRHKSLWAKRLLTRAKFAKARARRLHLGRDFVGAQRNLARAADLAEDGALLMRELERARRTKT